MNRTPHRRPGLTAVVAGIAALGGAGTLAAVLPPAGAAVHHRPVVVAAAAVGLSVPSSATGPASRARDTATAPGAGPFPAHGRPRHRGHPRVLSGLTAPAAGPGSPATRG